MELFVDKQKAEKKWSPFLEALKVTDPSKREWMAEYAEYHKMNENVSYSTLGTVDGMGSVVAAQPSLIPGQVWGGGQSGSGDLGQNLLPVSMKIAAQTIGLDLIHVKPVSSIRVDLVLLDFRYDDPNLDETDRPLVFKVNATNVDAIKTALYAQMKTLAINEMVGGIDKRTFISVDGATTATQIKAFEPNTATSVANWMEFLGFSRVDGLPMFRIFRQAVEKGTYNNYPVNTRNSFDLSAGSIVEILGANAIVTTSGTTTTSTPVLGATIELISLMEDHLPGFTSSWNLFTGMDRKTAENTYPGQIGTKTFTRSFSIGEISIKSAVKLQEMEDIKASTGMDITQKLENQLINELSQKISRDITQAIKVLAEKNRISHTAPKTVGGGSKFDFNVDAYLASGFVPGGEQAQSLQRKLITKISNAANFILHDGRVGRADYIVTNGNLATILQDISGYTVNPVTKANITIGNQLTAVGTINGMTIYIDPYMRWDDNRIFIGRKNTADQPGLIFCPFLMAQQVKVTSEATGAPVLMIRSRYAIADIGCFPEKQFMAIHVTDSNGILS